MSFNEDWISISIPFRSRHSPTRRADRPRDDDAYEYMGGRRRGQGWPADAAGVHDALVAQTFERLCATGGDEASTRAVQTTTDGTTGGGVVVGEGCARGRIDVMGGIGDYSGCVVAQMGTKRETRASVTFRERLAGENRLLVKTTMKTTTTTTTTSETKTFECDFRECFAVKTFDPAVTREYFETKRPKEDSWAAYAAGSIGEVFRALLRDEDDESRLEGLKRWIRRCALGSDCEVEIESDVPQGKGVASSAAVEVAVAKAVIDCALKSGVASLENPRFRAHVAMVPHYCHSAENNVVGAPCGFMDQYACFHCEPGSLLALNCDLHKTSVADGPEVFEFVEMPRELAVVGIDSGIRHSNTGGSGYAKVRCGTFMGKMLLVDELNARMGWSLHCDAISLCAVLSAEMWDHGSWGSPGNWYQHIDEEMTGDLYMATFGKHYDEPYTKVDVNETYAPRSNVSHALREHARVNEFIDILKNWSGDAGEDAQLDASRRLGDLMFASHDSYGSVGLGSTHTDDLVNLVRELDPERKHLFGAKITGGGSGGVVCVLHRDCAESRALIERVRERYQSTHQLKDKPDLILDCGAQ